MTTFTVIAYASNWTESCRGCVVDSGSSNFELKIAYTRDTAIYAYFKILRQAFDEKFGWDEITVLVNGSNFDDLTDGMSLQDRQRNIEQVKEIIERATETFNAYKAENERLAAEDKRIEETKMLASGTKKEVRFVCVQQTARRTT